ncbi:hypothetical protein CXB51_009814 [Gossypium anomalum]|uniref:Endonuclease/exonuclease/phosphatase domain-containing protein n=1 Tax=Gossypium anomalum TaxID=47600 RepID=A0A8J5YT68_9ROSI|nr:hypothetical protein CXB51_009813 [Gossypium anomalum]KAG8492299.1 hypothetical protein CXB51_009814 [Gossypium anomalum]
MLDSRAINDSLFYSDFIKRRDFIRKEAEETWRLVCWNVRGMGSSIKCGSVKKLVVNSKIDLIILLETKLEKVEDEIVQMIWKDSNRWCDCGALKDHYPRLFALDKDKVANAKDYSQNGCFDHQIWSSFFQRSRFCLGVGIIE